MRAVTEPVQMATLGGGHRTRTLWQPLGAVTGTRQIARGNLHNLIGDPDACPELYTTMIELRQYQPSRAPRHPRGTSSRVPKHPRVTSFSTFTSTYHRGELKPMHQMQWQGHTECPSPSLPNPTKATNAREENERKNEEENTKNSKI